MANSGTAVLTPQTQSRAEGALVPRKELKALMRRSNWPGLIRLAIWFMLVGLSGFLVWLALETWWLIPAMIVHGVVLVHHFSLMHECSHFTAFKDRWINSLVAYFCGFVIMLPPLFFRYEHTDHHTHTNLPGKDPELIALPRSIWQYLAYVSAVPYWKMHFISLVRKMAGRLTEEERRFIPEVERPKLILEARLMAAGYAAILAAVILFEWSAPIWFWWLPVLLGEPFMRAIRMTEHVGRPNVADMTINTRTNLVSAPLRFLCWNMNYHVEHHYASSVPFHALPMLHEKLKDHIHVETGGYPGAHADILRQIFGRKLRADAAADLV